jgi:hypothetical protein
LGKTRHSFKDITEDEGFVVGVSEEGKETKFSEGGKGDARHIDADRLRGGKNGAKVVVDYVDGGEVGAGGDNRVEEGIDGGKGGCVGSYVIVYVYLVSSYRPSHSSLS